ncbi:hypothetical protein [Aquisphaera insulae]|uniref:hypothetical protein n=1 Tax=Aquisphaera insulae TaxID=2712864 RepID=UPI0013ED5106|nr:hypothetical protein [Aquisphaera insulae]
MNCKTDLVPCLVGLTFLFLLDPASPASEFGLKSWRVESSVSSETVTEALRHFQSRVRDLGGPAPEDPNHPGPMTRLVVAEDRDNPSFTGLPPSRRDEAYLFESEKSGLVTLLAATSAGLVHGISDLETRLRANPGGVRIAFPEWSEGKAGRLLESPAIRGRGEYLNIGYDLPGITPHRWDTARWHWYVDRLVLARLNRWYFYLWIDGQSMFSGSKLAEKPENRRLHEGVREAIRYAHRRGLKVTFMVSPTMMPKDLWLARPDWKADIKYARDGFACVCPNAPGAWDTMKAVWQAEMDWFREADAVQVWFYDPGGCWCEQYGCKPHQAESLARQVREFGSLFRQLNPAAEVEYNFWPLSLWEAEMKVQVREDLARRILADSPTPAQAITAVGTPEGVPIPVPDLEQRLGMRAAGFLFCTNPESSYVFPTPHLRYLHRWAQGSRRLGLDAVFGHRLEARTRDSGTFLMGQWLWDPDQPADQVVRRFSEWQTADDVAGRRLSEAIGLLDELDRGINPELGRKLDDSLSSLLPSLPSACREDLEYWPAVGAALHAIAASEGADGPGLDAFADRFTKALAKSATFAPLVPRAGELFRSYRTMIRKVWEKEVY